MSLKRGLSTHDEKSEVKKLTEKVLPLARQLREVSGELQLKGLRWDVELETRDLWFKETLSGGIAGIPLLVCHFQVVGMVLLDDGVQNLGNIVGDA